MSEAGAASRALFTDFYELTMLQAYFVQGLDAPATFSLYFRRLPPQRNFLLACGLDDVLAFLEALRFDAPALDYLRGLGGFRDDFLDWLGALRFTGDVRAVPEGTPVFAGEPVLEVRAPLGEAQLVETYVMNQVHLQTQLASKAARVVAAARGRDVVDFGARRMHGTDAALKGARAFYVAGVGATSNVLAGRAYGIPLAGTMAHSYVQVHEREADAFAGFVELYPGTTLLVDTYDTLAAVHQIVSMARERGDAFDVGALRIDSGDLPELARRARRILDEAGLRRVRIFASGLLDERRIAELLDAGAPLDGFGVGTRMGVSADAPSADIAYKLTEYDGRGRLKTSPGKASVPGPKQVFRVDAEARDVIARADETLPGRPLLVPVMRAGRRLPAGDDTLEAARARAHDELARLPPQVRALDPADPPYPVDLSTALRADLATLTAG